jgi:hypothetical protein
VKDKTSIRYLGFRAAADGGRLFDFCVFAPGSEHPITTLHIAAQFLNGDKRIRLQEGVGICYSKLKHLLDIGAIEDVPSTSFVTESDLAEFRAGVDAGAKRSAGR